MSPLLSAHCCPLTVVRSPSPHLEDPVTETTVRPQDAATRADVAADTADTADTAHAAELLGGRIRQLRLARSLTLVQLAERADLSHPFLSQLERGLASPSMTSLERIAQALGTSRVELLAATEPRQQQVESVVLRASAGVRGPYGLGRPRLLGPEMLSFVPMEFTGVNTRLDEPHCHAEDEFLIVIEGDLELDFDGVTHRLAPRDSATIAAGTPHRWRSANGEPYRLIVVKEGWSVAGVRAQPDPGPDGDADAGARPAALTEAATGGVAR